MSSRSDLYEQIEELEQQIENLQGGFDDALRMMQTGRVKDALYEIEKALPDGFVGFPDDVVRFFGSKP